MIYVLTFAGFGAMLGSGGAVLQEVQQKSADGWPLYPPFWLAAAFLLAVLALYAVSWRVSVAWYGKYKSDKNRNVSFDAFRFYHVLKFGSESVKVL